MRREKAVINFANREHVSVAELARRMGFSAATIRRYARNGSISSVVIGSVYYLDPAKVMHEIGVYKEQGAPHTPMTPRPRKPIGYHDEAGNEITEAEWLALYDRKESKEEPEQEYVLPDGV